MLEPTQPKYRFHESDNGFIVEADDRPSVHVTAYQTHFDVQWADSTDDRNYCESYRYSLINYPRLTKRIADGLMRKWNPDPSKHHWSGVHDWAIGRTARGIGKRVQEQCSRLIRDIDPTIIRVQKAIYAATNSCGGVAMCADLYRPEHAYVVSDILNYRAAAIASRNVVTLINPGIRIHSPLEEGRIVTWESDAILREQACLEAMHSWKDLFSATGETYRSLNRTLMNLPGGVPDRLVCNLRLILLDHPITDRVELICAILAAQHHNRQNLDVFLRSTREELCEAMEVVRETFGCILVSPRRTKDLLRMVRYLCDYPEEYRGNVVGLARRSIQWHRQPTDWRRTSIELDASTPTARPPFPLPEHLDIHLLGTVGEVQEEGRKMHHCIASYAYPAAQGLCYLFHVEHEGETASVELSPEGLVRQSFGPRNTVNAAASWGARVLSRWGQQMTSQSLRKAA